MSGLPAGWVSVRLSELGRPGRPAIKAGPFGSSLKKEFYVAAGYRVYGQEQVIANNFSIGDYYIDDHRFEQLRACEVLPGDILISLVGTFGRTAVVPSGIEPGIINPRLIRLSLDSDRIEPKFVQHYFASPRVQAELSLTAHGGTMGVLSATTIAPLSVGLPPLPEQRRIVAKLESLQARSRRAREALEAVPPLLEKLRQSILAAAFRGDLTAEWREKHPDVEPASELLKRIRIERRQKWEQAELAKLKAKGKPPTDDRWKAKYVEPEPVDDSELPELPKGWCWASVEELAWNADYGTSSKCEYDGQGQPVLRIPNVVGGELSLEDMKRATTIQSFVPGEEILTGDFLMVRTNGSKDLVGRGAYVREQLSPPHYFASYLVRLRFCGPTTLGGWIGNIWASPQFRGSLAAITSSSAGQHNIALGNVRMQVIPIAPEDELVQITRLLRNASIQLKGISAVVDAAFNGLANLDSAILSKAFRGELVPQDPSECTAAPGATSAPGEPEATPNANTRARRARAARK